MPHSVPRHSTKVLFISQRAWLLRLSKEKMTSRRYGSQMAPASQASSSKRIKDEWHQFDSIALIGNGGSLCFCMCVALISIDFFLSEQGYGQVYKVLKANGKDKNEFYALKEVVVDVNESTYAIQKCEEKILNERKVMWRSAFVFQCHPTSFPNSRY